MNSQKALDFLSSVDELDRITFILDHFDTIISCEFIEFLKGQLEFAEKELNGAGYFSKVFEEEDAVLLTIMQKEMKIQANKTRKVWNSVLTVSSGLLDIDQFDILSDINSFEKPEIRENKNPDYNIYLSPTKAEPLDTRCN